MGTGPVVRKKVFIEEETAQMLSSGASIPIYILFPLNQTTRDLQKYDEHYFTLMSNFISNSFLVHNVFLRLQNAIASRLVSPHPSEGLFVIHVQPSDVVVEYDAVPNSESSRAQVETNPLLRLYHQVIGKTNANSLQVRPNGFTLRSGVKITPDQIENVKWFSPNEQEIRNPLFQPRNNMNRATSFF